MIMHPTLYVHIIVIAGVQIVLPTFFLSVWLLPVQDVFGHAHGVANTQFESCHVHFGLDWLLQPQSLQKGAQSVFGHHPSFLQKNEVSLRQIMNKKKQKKKLCCLQ
jgi:hypothetical protein